jgi:hypothetical protein
MYNEEIKQRYIAEKEMTTNTPDRYLSRQFDRTEEHELRLNKDLSSFTKQEILNMYKTFNFEAVETLDVMNSHFSLYTQWCLQQNLVPDCQDHFLEMNANDWLSCINLAALKKSVVSLETLYEWFEKLPNPSDKFIMLALFEGLGGQNFCELVNLRMADFDGNTVHLCTGRTLTVSSELVKLARESDNTFIYRGVGSAIDKEVPFKNEDLIIKNYPNCQDDTDEFQQGRRIYRRLIRNFTILGVDRWMKPNSLVESGKIHYINTRSKELGMTAKEYLFSDYVKEIKEIYGYDMKRLRVSYLRKYGDYLE